MHLKQGHTKLIQTSGFGSQAKWSMQNGQTFSAMHLPTSVCGQSALSLQQSDFNAAVCCEQKVTIAWFSLAQLFEPSSKAKIFQNLMLKAKQKGISLCVPNLWSLWLSCPLVALCSLTGLSTGERTRQSKHSDDAVVNLGQWRAKG